jgi:hypothetical protein
VWREEEIGMSMYDIRRVLERTSGHEVLLTKKEVYGLLAACDAYIEAEAELSFIKDSGEWEWHRERAREKLEEMLG